MDEPLRYKPFCVCDSSTVDRKDVIPTTMAGIKTLGDVDTHMGSIRYNPN